MTRRIADELDGIDLKDRRLNRRAQTLLETLAANPEASRNAAWKHAVPKSARYTGRRVSVTVRGFE